MSYDILTLAPNAYSKKLKRPNSSSQVDEVVLALGKKFSEWGLNHSSEVHIGAAHKLKYEQFNDQFLTKSNLILYVVNLSSEESFRSSIKKLITSCKNNANLSRITVLSLDKPDFEELHGTTIDLVYFGDNSWRSEVDSLWTTFEETLQKKLVASSNTPVTSKTDSMTASVQIPHNKSSKIKSFFHSLPSKFDPEKKWSHRNKLSSEIFNESVPNIKISDYQEEAVDSVNSDNKIELRPKESHSKLSLNSLFRKRSRKARDSGLSLNSSLSNGSDSKKSDTLGIDSTKNCVSADVSPCYERSGVLRTASLEKPKKYRATIEIFKNKANKAFQSANCLHSPANKRQKHVEDTAVDNFHFSGRQMNNFKDILVKDLDGNSKSHDALLTINRRGHSEPPRDVSASTNGIVKYYSWAEDLNESREVVSNSEQSAPTDEKYYQPFIYDEIFDHMESSDRLGSSSFAGDDETTTDHIDDNYFQLQYVPNTSNNSTKPEKHSVSFKIDGMDSLENIMESIEKSCHEMKVNFKTQNDNGVVVMRTFKEGYNEANELGKKHHEIHNEVIEQTEKMHIDQLHTMATSSPHDNVLGAFENEPLHTQSLVTSPSQNRAPQIPIRLESITDPQRSFLYRATTSIAKHPLIVISIFSATALTAPLWITFVPHGSDFGRLLSATINRFLGAGVIQSISNRLLSTRMISASASTDPVEIIYKNTLIRNIFFHLN